MSQKAFIFISHPYHRGGVTTWMVQAAKELVNRGIETFFLVPEPKYNLFTGGNRPSIISLIKPIKGLKIISQKVGNEFDLGTESYKIKVYKSLLNQILVEDAIIIPSDDKLVWTACVSGSNHTTFIGVLHSDEEYYYELYSQFKDVVACFVSVSQRIKRKVEDGSKPVYVIPCGIDLSLFQYQLLDKKKQIVWIGRLDEYQKKISDVIRIAKVLLQRNHSDFKIFVIGHGPMTSWLNQAIDEENLSNVVELLGWQNQNKIAKILSESKILLQTSIFEGMSVSVMEALAAGCCIVSSKVSGIEDLAEDPDAMQVIKLYEVGDTNSAAIHLENFLCDNTSHVEKARTLAEKYFSIQACMDKYIEISKDLKPKTSQMKPKKIDIRFIVNYIKTRMFYSWILAKLRIIKFKLKKLKNVWHCSLYK